MIRDVDPELDTLLDLLRRQGFRPLAVPAAGALDEGLIRHRGNLVDLLVLPDYGDATVLRAQTSDDRDNRAGSSAPSWSATRHRGPWRPACCST